jgi:hypothetical protein
MQFTGQKASFNNNNKVLIVIIIVLIIIINNNNKGRAVSQYSVFIGQKMSSTG